MPTSPDPQAPQALQGAETPRAARAPRDSRSGPQAPQPPSTAGRLLWRAIRRRRGRVAGSLALMTLWQVCEAFVPIAIGIIVNVAIVPLDGRAMLLSLLGIAALFTVLSLGYRFGARLANTALHQEAHALRVEVAEVPLASGAVAARSNAGEILSLSSADADVTSQVFRQIAGGGSAIIGLVAVSVYLLVTDLRVGLVVLVGVPLSLLLVALASRSISRHSTAQQEAIGLASRRAGDILAGLRVLNAGGGERWASAHYREASQRAGRAGVVTAERSGRLESIGALGTALVLALVLVVAGQSVLSGDLAIGTLVSVVGVAVFFQEPVRTITDMIGAFARSHGAARRIAEFLSAVPAEDTGDEVPETAGLRITGLALVTPPGHDAGSPVERDGQVPLETDFRRGGAPRLDQAARLDPSPRQTLSVRPTLSARLTLEVPPGRFLGLVVDDPAQAEAILHAVDGLGDQAGTVLIGGHPRSRLVPRLADHLVVAPHRVDLFAGTVRSNITLHHETPQVTDRGRVEIDPAVLAASGVTEIIGHFADGLEHRVDEGGRNLSGGQRQRLALARALHANPAVLVLHEPTSAVDAVTEFQIAQDVKSLRSGSGSGSGAGSRAENGSGGGAGSGAASRAENGAGPATAGTGPRTTVVVTSSPAFLAVADTVVQVHRDGTTTTGTHHGLLESSDAYRTAVAR